MIPLGVLASSYVAPAGGFTPASLSDLAFWLDNDGLSAGSLSSWESQSAAGGSASTIGTAPTVVPSSTPSGGASVRFTNTPMSLLRTDAPTVTASSSYVGWPAANLIDGSLLTDNSYAWSASATPPAWVQLDGPSYAATSYKILARANAATSAPGTWVFQGSTNGTDWTDLDTRSSETFTAGQLREFTFANTTSYTKYRLYITATGGASWPSFSELVVPGFAESQASVEAWLAVKADGASYNGLWKWNHGSAANAHSLYGPDFFFETFGVAAANTSHGSGAALTGWHIYRVVNDGTNLDTYRNGTLLNSYTVTSQGGTQWTSAPVLGRTYYNSMSSSFSFTGNIAEIVVIDSALSAGDAATLLDYLNNKHGII